MATPTCDETLTAQGCIDIAGGKGVFDLSASYTVATAAKTGTLSYRDTAAGFEFTTSAILDYSETDSNMRGFIFALSQDGYDQARVFVMDNGASGDQFLIQLFSGGFIVYERSGTLSTDCGGGVTINSECGGTTPPPPAPEPPPGKRHPKGNNGVGNGIDPQPPGNPPINDGPGTGPGNPGNRGGANPKDRKG